MSETRREAENYQKVLGGWTALSFRDFERLLVALGFKLKRQSGSHRIYGHQRRSDHSPFSRTVMMRSAIRFSNFAL